MHVLKGFTIIDDFSYNFDSISLKVLKRYHALWGMNRVKTRRPHLYIVNLQVMMLPLAISFCFFPALCNLVIRIPIHLL